jgi:putative nucleotidyltransferase with HDIG domain
VPQEALANIRSRLDRGLVQQIYSSGATILSPPTVVSPEDLEAIGAPKARSLVLQPCMVDSEVVGLVALGSSRAGAFDEMDLAVSSYVAKLVGIAWDRLRQEAELVRRNSILSTLAQVTDHLLRDDTWEAAVDEVLQRLGTVTEVSRAYVFENRRDKAGTLLTSQRFEWVAPGVQSQIDNPDLQDLPLIQAGFSRWARLLSHGERIVGLVREFPHSEQQLLADQGIQSMLVVPITAKGRWWGFMGFDDCERERAWTRMEIDTLQTAAHALGAAIRSHRIRRRMERAQRRAQESNTKLERAIEGTVGALLTIMETRDQRLANHQQRVAELALAMAQLMGLDRDQQKATWLAALMHDLGKLSLPFWLVAEGEPADANARGRFRAHVRLGQQVLEPLGLPWPVAEIVGQHHERPDGRGYPLGLRSPKIRTEASIIRVADYVETRVTKLEYGDGNSLERVLERLVAGADARFDSEAAQACVSLFEGSGFFFTTASRPPDNPDAILSSVPPRAE